MKQTIKAANCCYPDRLIYKVKYVVTLPSGSFKRKVHIELTKNQNIEMEVMNRLKEDEPVFGVLFKSIKLL